ncbi:unnamed protein product, partial [Ectocarpus sp. 13 AM-2016]
RRDSAPARPPTDGCIAQQPGGVVDGAGEVRGGRSTFVEGPLNPYKQARRQPPVHGQRPEQPGSFASNISCTTGKSL